MQKQGHAFLFFTASRPNLTTCFWKDLEWRMPYSLSNSEDPLPTAISTSQNDATPVLQMKGCGKILKTSTIIFFLPTWEDKIISLAHWTGPPDFGACGQKL